MFDRDRAMTKVRSVRLVVGINPGIIRQSLPLARNVRLGSDGKAELIIYFAKENLLDEESDQLKKRLLNSSNIL